MATGGSVLDTLVVELGLDPSKFTKGQKDALDALRKLNEEALKGAKEAESSSKAMMLFFSRMKTAAIAAFSAHEVKKTFDNIRNLDAGISRATRTLDISERELSDWQGAVEQAGGKAEDATAAIQAFNDQISALKSGGAVSAEFVGIMGQYLNENQLYTMKSTEQILLLVDAMKKAGLAAPVMAYQLKTYMPGMTDGMINALIKGREEFERLKKQAHDAGGTTKEAGDAAVKYQERLTNLEQKIRQFGRVLIGWVIDPLTRLVDLLLQLASGDFSFSALFKSKTDPDIEKKIKAGADELRRGGGDGGKTPTAAPPTGGTAPASVRYNNPGAQYPNERGKVYGQEGAGVIGGGHLIAKFPTPEQGAASNMDLLARKYAGMQIGSAGAKWTGGLGVGVPGFDPRTVITREMMNDPAFAIPLMKGIAKREAGRPSPLTDEQWQKAFKLYQLQNQDANPFGAPAAASASRGGDKISSNSSSTNINGDIVIHTNATDARGIAADIRGELSRVAMATPFNGGLV